MIVAEPRFSRAKAKGLDFYLSVCQLKIVMYLSPVIKEAKILFQKIQNFDLQEEPLRFSMNFFHPSVCIFG
jgi:hypothetical protein